MKRREEDLISDLAKQSEDINRSKEDGVSQHTRAIENLTQDLVNFKETIDEKKDTINDLIKSVDENLARFGRITGEKSNS